MNELQSTLTLTGNGRLRRDTRLVFALLEKIRGGLLEVRLPDGARFLFGEGEPGVTMQINKKNIAFKILLSLCLCLFNKTIKLFPCGDSLFVATGTIFNIPVAVNFRSS